MASDFSNILNYIVDFSLTPFNLAEMPDYVYFVLPLIGSILLPLALVVIKFIVRIVRNVG